MSAAVPQDHSAAVFAPLRWAITQAMRGLGALSNAERMELAEWIAGLAVRRNRKRYRILRRNLQLCFPQLPIHRRRALAVRCVTRMVYGWLSLGVLWRDGDAGLDRLVSIQGLEHLDAAAAQGRGVTLLAPHWAGLELGGIALARARPMFSMVSTEKGATHRWFVNKLRVDQQIPVVTRDRGLRPVLEGLGQGLAFYYLPDQDHGGRAVCVHAPFFGLTGATPRAAGGLIARSGAPVVPSTTHQTEDGRFVVSLEPALAGFGEDAETNCMVLRAAVQRMLQAHPEDYMWTLRLFQYQPGHDYGWVYGEQGRLPRAGELGVLADQHS